MIIAISNIKNVIITIIFIVVSVSFGINTIDAQNNTAQERKLSVGVEITPQFTNISSASYAGSDTKVRPYTGVFIIYDASEIMKFKTGLYFDMRSYGIHFKSTSLSFNDSTNFTGFNSYYELDVTNTVNYLTVPVNFFYQKGNGKLKVYVEGGLYFAIALNNKVKGFNDYFIHPDDLEGFNDSTLTSGHHYNYYDGSVDNYFNTYDIGINLGLGISYYVKPDIALQFSPGFSYGLANVFENPERSSKWNNIFKLHLALVYKLKEM